MPRPRNDSVASSTIDARQLEGRDDDDRRHHVGQHVAQHHAGHDPPRAWIASTNSRERSDEHLGAQDAGVGDPAGEPDDHDQRRKARAEHGDDADGEQDEREGELGVRDGHDDRVHPAAREAGEDARAPTPADRPRPRRRSRSTSETREPIDHAREHVAPEMVGAEEMRPAVGPLERGRRQPAAQRPGGSGPAARATAPPRRPPPSSATNRPPQSAATARGARATRSHGVSDGHGRVRQWARMRGSRKP